MDCQSLVTYPLRAASKPRTVVAPFGNSQSRPCWCTSHRDGLVCALEIINRACEKQLRIDVPLNTNFGVLELLRIQDKRARIQGTKLIAGGRQVRDAVGTINRQIVDGLHDNADARRNLVVRAIARDARILIQRSQIKLVETRASDQLQPARYIDLVLRISRRNIETILAVCVGGLDTIRIINVLRVVNKVDLPKVRWIERIDTPQRICAAWRSVREDTCITLRKARLPAKICAECNRVENRASESFVGKVGLVE